MLWRSCISYLTMHQVPLVSPSVSIQLDNPASSQNFAFISEGFCTWLSQRSCLFGSENLRFLTLSMSASKNQMLTSVLQRVSGGLAVLTLYAVSKTDKVCWYSFTDTRLAAFEYATRNPSTASSLLKWLLHFRSFEFVVLLNSEVLYTIWS